MIILLIPRPFHIINLLNPYSVFRNLQSAIYNTFGSTRAAWDGLIGAKLPVKQLADCLYQPTIQISVLLRTHRTITGKLTSKDSAFTSSPRQKPPARIYSPPFIAPASA